ncbi:uncharacterized protein KGF55_002780 [Candida pseudojiufengensis]|uniref:uncharacterized protein n=1 Tax=Candida pseudojiufengensis TaxID=497109 RepID=UPI0022246F1E|nr:uncharacterized protein KGF55_002780 [Candida pseudojiufengensis]KAI5962988.1 hypothetical protein KGF55_002780 [Candida pseudojiufengensis]
MTSNELGHSNNSNPTTTTTSSTTKTKPSRSSTIKDSKSTFIGKSANYHAQLTKSLFQNYNKSHQALQLKNNSTMQQFNNFDQSYNLPDFIDFKPSDKLNSVTNNNHNSFSQLDNNYFIDRGSISVPSSRIENYYTNNTIEEEIQQIIQNHEDLHYFDQNSNYNDLNNNNELFNRNNDQNSNNNDKEYGYTLNNDIVDVGKSDSVDSNLKNLNNHNNNNHNQHSSNEFDYQQSLYSQNPQSLSHNHDHHQQSHHNYDANLNSNQQYPQSQYNEHSYNQSHQLQHNNPHSNHHQQPHPNQNHQHQNLAPNHQQLSQDQYNPSSHHQQLSQDQYNPSSHHQQAYDHQQPHHRSINTYNLPDHAVPNDIPNYSSNPQTMFETSNSQSQPQHQLPQSQQQQHFEPKLKMKRGRPRKKPGFYLKLDGVNKKPTMLNRMISSSQSDSGTDYWNRTPLNGPIGISKLSFTPAQQDDYELKKDMELNDNYGSVGGVGGNNQNIPAFNLTPSIEPPIGTNSYFELDNTPKNESLNGGGFFSPAINENNNNNNNDTNHFNQTFEAYLQSDPSHLQPHQFNENHHRTLSGHQNQNSHQLSQQHQQHQQQQQTYQQPQNLHHQHQHPQQQPPHQQHHQHQQHQQQQHQHQPPHQQQSNPSFTPLNFDVFNSSDQHDHTTSIQNDDYHSFEEDDPLGSEFDEQFTVSQYMGPEDEINDKNYLNLHKTKSNHSINSVSSDKSITATTGTTSTSTSITPKTKKRVAKGAVCPVCDKYISRDLTRHMRIHNEIGRFQCVYPKHMCNHKTQNFNRPYDYKKHLLHSHFKFDDPKGKNANTLGDKLPIPGCCIACGSRYIANDWLNEHVLTKDLNKRCAYVEEYQHQPNSNSNNNDFN